MALAPVALVRQWPIEGGRISKPHGLGVEDIATPSGAVSYVELDKNGDWLLKAVIGTASQGALRMTVFFKASETMLKHANADTVFVGSPHAPKEARPPPKSRRLNLATP